MVFECEREHGSQGETLLIAQKIACTPETPQWEVVD
jgi:hypothetical protein